MHMRTTINLRDELVAEGQKATGIEEKTALVDAGLQALVDRAQARRLAALGGSEPGAVSPTAPTPSVIVDTSVWIKAEISGTGW